MELWIERSGGPYRLREEEFADPSGAGLFIEIPPPPPTAEQLFAEQRARRIAKRVEIEAALAGDPVARADLDQDWAPIVEAHRDWSAAGDPDDLDSEIVVNQDLNL